MTEEKTITLRLLGPDDIDLLLAVPDDLFDEAIRPDQARLFLDNPLHHCFLAFDGDLAVGMATGVTMYHPDKPPAMFINEIGTLDSHLRRGIGTMVTRALIDHARTIGCKGIWLGTETANAAAIGLYRSMDAEELVGVYFGWDGAF